MNSSRRSFIGAAIGTLSSVVCGAKVKNEYILALLTPAEFVIARKRNCPSNTGLYNCHIQAIKVSANFGREQIYELGRKRPYYKFVKFPIEKGIV